MSGAHSPSAYAAGLACRCPRCGRGRLFDGYLTVRPVCDACGLDLASHDTGDGPSVFVIFILGAVVVPLALTVEAAFQPPLWLHAALWSVAVLGGTLALLRPLKGLLVALHYRHRAAAE
ncbi:MAG TPA: DUF983 domain-containing protein [Thalassobaculum sp.]